MHPVINRQDRTPGDERDASFGLQIEGRHEISFKHILWRRKTANSKMSFMFNFRI